MSVKGRFIMIEISRRLIGVEEVTEILNVSKSYAYKIIVRLNRELENAGYLTVPGKVDSLYLEKRYFPSPEKIISAKN